MTGRRIVIGLLVICLGTGAVDFFMHKHPHFAVEDIPAFYGLFGLAGVLVLVAVAKVLGALLRRREDFYGE